MCLKGDGKLGLVNIVARGLKGKPTVVAKYTGLHTLRHFFASWCINRKEDGMTMDTYGHLFPRGDDSAELAAAERLLLGIA